MNTISDQITFIVRALAVGLVSLAAAFLFLSPVAQAQSTAYPTDVIESPRVKKADIPTHFQSVFSREPTAGELKYWQTRLKDKPTEYYFLGALSYWAAKGLSPSVEDAKFTLTLSGTGTDVFEGQTRRHTVTLMHTNPIAQSGYLDIKTNTADVKPTVPLPNTQRTYVGGITRLRHRYHLAPDATLSVNFITTAPKPPKLTFEALLPGRGLNRQHVTKVYKALPDNLKGTTYHERQVPLIFARVFGRTPTAKELTYWRSRLKKTKRLETIQGAMEVHKLSGTTSPGTVLGITSLVAVREINSLFRSVYGRTPTFSEWHYWAGRLSDKPGRAEYMGAIGYHHARTIVH